MKTEKILDRRETVRLENDVLKLDILPQLGAKMISLFYKLQEKELLWKTPEEVKDV